CGSSQQICPFAYELARLYTQLASSQNPGPIAQHASSVALAPWRSAITSPSAGTALPGPRTLFGITSFSENFLQAWLHPILDFSLPPDRAYRTISACELLGTCTGEGNALPDLANTVVLIVPGGYDEAGIDVEDSDSLPPPAALSVWQQDSFTRGEGHAYMLHHLLRNHRVYPIPDLWMILLMAICAKELRLRLPRDPKKRQHWAIAAGGVSLGYGLLCLQIFRAAEIVVPMVLPVTVLWLYAYLAYRSGAHRSGQEGRRLTAYG
ncbi:MAG: hypothetical protein ABG776_20765, partial [Cyanobacteria bacterium J06555_13]